MIKVKDNRDRVTVAKVYRAKQEHIFKWWDELSESEKASLLEQVRKVDLRFVSEMRRRLRAGSNTVSFGELEPAPVIRLSTIESDKKRFEELKAVGEERIRKGKVAIVTVAGGVSSRMGLFGSKALLKIGPITGKTLIQFFAEKIVAISKRYSTLLPWIIMTSDTTDAQIKELFEQNRFFSLPKGTVHFLRQGTVPVLDDRGRLIMEDKGKIALSPNGHGGFFDAFTGDGLLNQMLSTGIEDLFYFQVDNPAVKIADPVFLGLHYTTKAEFSSKVVWKKNPQERLGIFALEDGKIRTIEYTELPPELASQVGNDGTLRFGAGSIAVHIISLGFLKRLSDEGVRLPYHMTKRRVPYIDGRGRRIVPTANNANKFEKFIFDIIRHTDKVTLLETRREEEFCPIKEAEGEESLETAQRFLSNLFGNWLKNCGVEVPTDESGNVLGVIEISPLFALDSDELKAKIPAGGKFTGSLCLEP